ncbi:hypothetical protein OK016_20115 [Vibrio chagasii]|nr:hypothetical protein [Vibrio chagasii]
MRDGNKLVPTNRAILLKDKLDDLLGEFDHLLDDKLFEPQEWQESLHCLRVIMLLHIFCQ